LEHTSTRAHTSLPEGNSGHLRKLHSVGTPFPLHSLPHLALGSSAKRLGSTLGAPTFFTALLRFPPLGSNFPTSQQETYTLGPSPIGVILPSPLELGKGSLQISTFAPPEQFPSTAQWAVPSTDLSPPLDFYLTSRNPPFILQPTRSPPFLDRIAQRYHTSALTTWRLRPQFAGGFRALFNKARPHSTFSTEKQTPHTCYAKPQTADTPLFKQPNAQFCPPTLPTTDAFLRRSTRGDNL